MTMCHSSLTKLHSFSDLPPRHRERGALRFLEFRQSCRLELDSLSTSTMLVETYQRELFADTHIQIKIHTHTPHTITTLPLPSSPLASLSRSVIPSKWRGANTILIKNKKHWTNVPFLAAKIFALVVTGKVKCERSCWERVSLLRSRDKPKLYLYQNGISPFQARLKTKSQSTSLQSAAPLSVWLWFCGPEFDLVCCFVLLIQGRWKLETRPPVAHWSFQQLFASFMSLPLSFCAAISF